MKRNLTRLLCGVMACCMGLCLCAGLLSAYGAGSAENPLITYSYMQNRILPGLKDRMTEALSKLFPIRDHASEIEALGEDALDELSDVNVAAAVAEKLTSGIDVIEGPSVTSNRVVELGLRYGISAEPGTTVTVISGEVHAVAGDEGSVILVAEAAERSGEAWLLPGDRCVVTEKGRVFFTSKEGAKVLVSGPASFKTPLLGYVGIKGTAVPGNTLSPELSVVTSGGDIAYRWLLDGRTVSEEKDYTVSSSDVGGKLTLEVIASGDGCGKLVSEAVTVAKGADVVRVFGGARYETAFKSADELKALLGVEKFDCIVVASGTEFADALSGCYLANQKNAPILLVRPNNTTISQVKAYINENLNPGGTVYLLGGTVAVPASMESGLGSFNVKRLSGADRYGTNLAILKEAGVTGGELLVCSGASFADGLSVSAVDAPVLLVKKSLTESQKAFLSGGSFDKIHVIGGKVAVSEDVEKTLKTYGAVARVGGATRYETSVMIAETFFSGADSVVLVYGADFPDGLSGGCLASAKNAPLILTYNGKQAAAKNYVSARGVTGGYVLGGPGLISDRTVRDIFSLGENGTIAVR